MKITWFKPFAANSMDACCLCGAANDLTGEHKIKASLLKEEFGSAQMVIGNFDASSDKLKQVQSPRSKALHFKARMCSRCNNDRSQKADEEFVRFHKYASELLQKSENLKNVFENTRYTAGSEPYLNVFRYLAKILCCQMADAGAPRPLHMAKFAIGQKKRNCIWLNIDQDFLFKQLAERGVVQYAAHGGLVVYGDKATGGPNAFHSTITVGSIRYIFYSRLTKWERYRIMRDSPEYYLGIKAAQGRPISTDDKLRLGLPL